jgi:glycosyltransferase involved in cell wall biosynthesis
METDTKKKVLLFIPEFPTLTETFIEREVSKLAESSVYDVHVSALRRGKGKLSDNLVSRVNYSRMEYADLPGVLLFFFWNLFTKHSKLLSLYKEVFGNKLTFKNIWLFVRSIGYYYPVFQSFNPDYIYAHFLSEPSTVAMIVARYLGLPYGISAHAKDIFVSAEFVKQKVESARFITICNKRAYEYCIDLARREGASEDAISQRIHLIYHGADFNKIENLGHLTSTRGNNAIINILSVGRLVEKKGYKYLIEASKILKDKGISHKVNIIGPGPLYEELRKCIDQSDLADTVYLLGTDGSITFEDTVSYYRNADIFAFAGIQTDSGDSDGIANVLIEAAIFKLPVICTDAGSAQDLIQNEKNGVVVPQKDAMALAHAIEMLISSPELRARLGTEVYADCKKQFDLNSNIIHIEQLLSH